MISVTWRHSWVPDGTGVIALPTDIDQQVRGVCALEKGTSKASIANNHASSALRLRVYYRLEHLHLNGSKSLIYNKTQAQQPSKNIDGETRGF